MRVIIVGLGEVGSYIAKILSSQEKYDVVGVDIDKQRLSILEDLYDIQTLEGLASKIKDSSLCGLGQTAPNPVLTTLRYFRNEYEAHINDKRCPAGVCKALITYMIQEDNCVGCGRCLKLCPVGAITGSKKLPHKIDQDKCIKCSACLKGCKFEAIVKE